MVFKCPVPYDLTVRFVEMIDFNSQKEVSCAKKVEENWKYLVFKEGEAACVMTDIHKRLMSGAKKTL